LIKDKRRFDQRINQLKEESDVMMIHKFGRIIDLEKLETITINRPLEEVKARLNMAEADCATEMLQWKVGEDSILGLVLCFSVFKMLNHSTEVRLQIL